VLGLATTLLMPTPDVLIDATGKLAAVRTPTGGYSVSSLSTKRFERDVWLRRAGLSLQEGRWPRAQAGPVQAIRCDALGCVYQTPAGPKVAFVTAAEALAEDCQGSGVVVNLSAAPGPEAEDCPVGVRINLGDLAQKGTHALYFGEKGDFGENGAVSIETVRDLRGERPWVLGSGVLTR